VYVFNSTFNIMIAPGLCPGAQILEGLALRKLKVLYHDFIHGGKAPLFIRPGAEPLDDRNVELKEKEILKDNHRPSLPTPPRLRFAEPPLLVKEGKFSVR
jgi:hypothetical protein